MYNKYILLNGSGIVLSTDNAHFNMRHCCSPCIFEYVCLRSVRIRIQHVIRLHTCFASSRVKALYFSNQNYFFLTPLHCFIVFGNKVLCTLLLSLLSYIMSCFTSCIHKILDHHSFTIVKTCKRTNETKQYKIKTNTKEETIAVQKYNTAKRSQ